MTDWNCVSMCNMLNVLNTEKATALVKRMQQQVSLATYVKSQLVFITFLNLHIIRQYNIIPEHSPLPAPTLPLLLLNIKVLSVVCGGYCGTFYCWCCGGPLPSDISWLSHFKRNNRKYNNQPPNKNKKKHVVELHDISCRLPSALQSPDCVCVHAYSKKCCG